MICFYPFPIEIMDIFVPITVQVIVLVMLTSANILTGLSDTLGESKVVNKIFNLNLQAIEII